MDKKSVYALLLVSGMIWKVTCLTSASPESTDLMTGVSTINTTMTTVRQTSQDYGFSMISTNMTKPSNSDVNSATEELNRTLTTENLGSLAPALPTASTKNTTDNITSPPPPDVSIAYSTFSAIATSVTPKPATTDKAKPSKGSLTTGLIVLFVFIALFLIILIYCWLQYRKRERNTFNLYHASPDNADIPLSSGTVEKKAAENMKEDKVDIHHIEPPAETSAADDSPKQGQSSDAADAPESDLNSTASTVPKDDEPDRLSLDSSQASLLPPGMGNLKTQVTDQAEDVIGGPPSGSSVETPSAKPNENNNNRGKWTIDQLKTEEREPFMRADREETEGRWAGDASQADIAKPSSFSDISLNLEPWSAADRLFGTEA